MHLPKQLWTNQSTGKLIKLERRIGQRRGATRAPTQGRRPKVAAANLLFAAALS